MLKRLFSPSKKAPEIQKITIVSGLPRSGTSMMMKMLAAGGMPILTDHIRTADDDNPGGYYEFEPVKGLIDGKSDWLSQATGKAVKVIATLLTYLPDSYTYQVVFIQRAMPEILASQRKMLLARGKDPDAVSDEDMSRIFNAHLQKVTTWMQKQPNLTCLMIDYNTMLANPHPHVEEVGKFFNGTLDISKMAQVIDPNLYRHRS